VVVGYGKVITGALVLDDVDPAEDSAQGLVDDRLWPLLDDDGIDSERFGVEGVLKLEAEDIAVGQEGKLDTVAEGGMPGDGIVGGSVFSDDDGPPLGDTSPVLMIGYVYI
jgi:hypothetical protein